MTSEASTTHRDPTFRNYDKKAAASYAAHRLAYPPELVEMVLDNHTSTGGSTGVLLDVGCGPGTATSQLAPLFQHVTGVDPGQSMIEMARGKPMVSASGEKVNFLVAGAEDLASIAEPESVDLITAATAAHWFNMEPFYVAASKVLRPGGSIVMWAGARFHPDSAATPNGEKIRKIWDEVEQDVFLKYEQPGNKLTRELYATMQMPWTLTASDPATKEALAKFDPGLSKREVFNEDGIPDDRFHNGYLSYTTASLDSLGTLLGTASQVTRYREANRGKIESGEIEDRIERAIRLTREALDEVPGGKEVTKFGFGTSMVLIVIKKKAAP